MVGRSMSWIFVASFRICIHFRIIDALIQFNSASRDIVHITNILVPAIYSWLLEYSVHIKNQSISPLPFFSLILLRYNHYFLPWIYIMYNQDILHSKVQQREPKSLSDYVKSGQGLGDIVKTNSSLARPGELEGCIAYRICQSSSQ